MTKEKALQMLPCLGQHPDRCCPGSHQIAHRFMSSVWYPDRRQFAGTMQFGQHHRVATIRLDPIAGLNRNQRWRHNYAVMPATGQKPMKSIPTRAGFVAETKPRPAPGETSRHLDQNLGTVLKNPELPNPSTESTFGHRRADGRLVHVQSDICDIFHQARPHAGGSVPAIRPTLDIVHAEDGPPITQRTSGLEQEFNSLDAQREACEAF